MRSRISSNLALVSVLALGSLCTVGCSRKNNPDFGGTFAGKSIMTMTLQMPDGTTDKGDAADSKPDDDTYKIEDLDQPEIKLTVLDDDDHCTLQATRTGATATIKPGQTCVTKDKDGSMSLKVSSGKVALAGDDATMDLVFSTTTKVEGATIPGTMTIHFVGKRG